MKRATLPPNDQTSLSQNDPAKTVAESIYRRLRADIVWGVFPPGAALRSNDLRTTYSVGISPLREALSRLTMEKFVTTIGQRGFRVAPIDPDDVIDVAETRLIVERAALARSIKVGDLKWETRVVAAFHALSRTPLPPVKEDLVRESWARHHREFHMALLSGCGSLWQMNLAALFFDQTDRFRLTPHTQSNARQSPRDPAEEHKRIMQAALSRNIGKAVEALEGHYRATTDQILGAIGRTDPTGLQKTVKQPSAGERKILAISRTTGRA